MSQYTIGSVALKGINKAGTLKPDADGWYDVYLGALEFPNSKGWKYAVDPLRQILQGNNILTRRLREGRLFGELGHPRMLPGMKPHEFQARLLDIYEQNESHAIKEITIDAAAKDKHGRPIIAIRGKIKPSGPYAYVTEQKIKDRDINLCFSLRAFAEDKIVDGVVTRYLRVAVTFDQVGEPGINIADKYNAPALESYEGINMTSDDVHALRVSLNQSGAALESSPIALALDEIQSAMAKPAMEQYQTPYYQPKSLAGQNPAWIKSLY